MPARPRAKDPVSGHDIHRCVKLLRRYCASLSCAEPNGKRILRIGSCQPADVNPGYPHLRLAACRPEEDILRTHELPTDHVRHQQVTVGSAEQAGSPQMAGVSVTEPCQIVLQRIDQITTTRQRNTEKRSQQRNRRKQPSKNLLRSNKRPLKPA